jgi:hypothetical protein
MTTIDAAEGRGLGERDGLRWWPSVLGIAVAAAAGIGTDGTEVAWVITVAALVYVGAAASGNGRSAWWWFIASVPVIVICELLDVSPETTTWVFVAIAAALVAWGVARGRWGDQGGLQLQTVAMVAFAAVSLVTFAFDATVGSLLVAAGLIAHGAWDVYHHRINSVVVRSYAEVCVALDVPLAGILIANAVT